MNEVILDHRGNVVFVGKGKVKVVTVLNLDSLPAVVKKVNPDLLTTIRKATQMAREVL